MARLYRPLNARCAERIIAAWLISRSRRSCGGSSPVPEVDTPDAVTLRDGLEAAFALNPLLRGYVLDDQGHLRVNVVVLIDGRRSHDRVTTWPTPWRLGAEVLVLQALSGG